MRHPRSIAERRHNRVTVMARRRKVILRWYHPNDRFKPQDNSAWNSCDKWNLNCSCCLCHWDKRFSSFRRQRRRQLRRDIAENVAGWLHNSSRVPRSSEA
jgi:hypothetical protein